jgi:GT2 family glycosyltransferase
MRSDFRLSPQSSVLSPTSPLLSFIISTFNRREAILQTLAVLRGPAGGSGNREVIVVDNASIDGTADAIAQGFPEVNLIRQRFNGGPCAKNRGIESARGKYLVFLDDDSFPQADSIDRMVAEFEDDPALGAAVFSVRLPSGVCECSAYPDVFAGCGVGLRAEAIGQVGGLPDDFFMQAEEYDLSLRLLDAGWKIRRFADIGVTHLKTPRARFPGRVMRLDVRNNLTLIARYFPDEWVMPFASDWARRYRMLAQVHRRLPAYYAGLAAGIMRLALRRGRRPVKAATFETFAKINEIERRLRAAAAEYSLKRVVFVDLGKNILPYWRAAERCGIEVVALADAKLGGHSFSYRGTPIVTDTAALKLNYDGVVVSNLSPVHAAQRRQWWRGRTEAPVIDLFEGNANGIPARRDKDAEVETLRILSA